MSNSTKQFVRAAALAEVENNGRLTVQVEGHTVALFAHEGSVFAVDNRCPHMGFPLDQGTLHDG
ncbi:MAG: Rieske 2Fe-2S domain-containing protein, partial [Anaerolineaceae bacterium]